MTVKQSPYHFLMAEVAPVRGNVTHHVTDALRRAIVTLELKPGEVLDKGAICMRLGVSRFPVSEALSRLSVEGLVDILPQRGSIVSRIRIADVTEYMLIRKALESEAVRVLAERRDPKALALIEANLLEQRAYVAQGDRQGFHTADLAFHELLFQSLRYDKVRNIIEGVRANLDRARRVILSPRRLTLSLAEHEIIFAALVAGDGERSAQGMRAHVDAVLTEFLAFSNDHNDLFADGMPRAANTQ